MNYREAIAEAVKNKGVEVRGDSYRAYIHDDGKFNVGTFATEEDARSSVFIHWVNRFENAIFSNGMNPFDGVVVFGNYVIFPNGRLFNLKGYELQYDISPGGRPYTVTLNGVQRNIRNIYKQVFGEQLNDVGRFT